MFTATIGSLTGEGAVDRHARGSRVLCPAETCWLLAKSLLWCHLHGVPAIALGSLQTNPFPDATPEFLSRVPGNRQSRGGRSCQSAAAFRRHEKGRRDGAGKGLPLAHTFSCAAPKEGLHCGKCSKCGERRDAFADARMVDPTVYHRS